MNGIETLSFLMNDNLFDFYNSGIDIDLNENEYIKGSKNYSFFGYCM